MSELEPYWPFPPLFIASFKTSETETLPHVYTLPSTGHCYFFLVNKSLQQKELLCTSYSLLSDCCALLLQAAKQLETPGAMSRKIWEYHQYR